MADNFINKINVNNIDYFLSPTFTSQTQNYVLAAPSNENGMPSFRKLVEADIPDLSEIYLNLNGGTIKGDLKLISDSTGITETSNKRLAWTTSDGTLVGYIATSSNGAMGFHGTRALYFRPGDADGMISTSTGVILNNSSFYPYSNKGMSLGSEGRAWSSVYATTFIGDLTGNADTATAFSSGTTVKLTGDTTGESSSSTKGWKVTTTTKFLSGTNETTEALTTSPGTGKIKYSFHINKGTAGLFAHTSNANSIITLNKHAGNYDSQLGFSSNGNIYYRNFSDSALDTETFWKQLAFTDSTVERATADASGNTITSTYAPLASPILTGTPTLRQADSTALITNNDNSNKLATTEFVMNRFRANDAMLFKGTIGASKDNPTTTSLPDTHDAGWTYRVITDGTYPIVDSNGKYCEEGTLIICTADGTSANPADWTSVETNEDGAVIGTTPTSSTDNAIVRWNSTSGRIIKNSGITIDDSNNINNVKTLTISDTGTNNHINLSRTGGHSSPNYINVPKDSALAISVGGTGGANISAMFEKNGILPYMTNNRDLGAPDTKWRYVYATAFKGNADTATSLTNFVVSTYTLQPSKGVRIKYPTHQPVLISASRQNSYGGLILLGRGYGKTSQTAVRNNFTEIVSSSGSYLSWSIPESNEFECSIEIMNNQTSGNASIVVWTTEACTFTEIDQLTTTATDRRLLDANNYSIYALPLSGGNLTGPVTTGNITIGGTSDAAKTISSSDNLYINRPAEKSIIFQQGGIHKIFIDPSNSIRPAGDGELSIGTADHKWNAVYASTFYGTLSGSATYLQGVNQNVEAISVSSQITSPNNGLIRYDYRIGKNSTGLFEHTTNSDTNSILTLSTGGNNRYFHQLGFSTNKKLYHRAFIGDTPNDNTPGWKEIAYIEDITSNAFGYFKQDEAGLTRLSEGNDLNSFKTFGTYNSAESSQSRQFINSPINNSGFKLYIGATYHTGRPFQIAWGLSATPWVRVFNSSASNGGAWLSWGKLVYSEINQPDDAHVGSSAQAVYINATGKVVAAKQMLPLEGGTMTGPIISTYASKTYKNSLTSSVITINKGTDTDTYHGWICGPTKNGRIAIATYNNVNDILYFGYAENEQTGNLFTRSMQWDGATGRLTTGGITLPNGHLYLDGTVSSSTNNKAQIVFRNSNQTEVAAISGFLGAENKGICINPSSTTTADENYSQIRLYLNKESEFPKGINANITGNLTGKVTGSLVGNATISTGHLYLTGAGQYSTNNTTQIIFKAGIEGEQIGTISAISSENTNGKAIVINPSYNSSTNQIIFYFDKPSKFPKGIEANITGNLTGNATTATSANTATVLTTNTITSDTEFAIGVRAYQGSGNTWTGINSMGFAGILQIGGESSRMWQIWARRGANNSLHWRNKEDNMTTWGTERIILDSSNTAAGADNNATLNWGTTYTIAKINGTDIKFTTMAEPTNAATATSWANDRTVYVALGTASKTTTINGGAANAAAIALGIDGTLAVSHGGTGITTIEPHKVLIGHSSGSSAAAPTWRTLVAADLPTATATALGIAKFGTGLSVSSGEVTLDKASSTALGGINPLYSTSGAITASHTAFTLVPTIQSRSTTAGRYYAIEVDTNGVPFVNVPWTDTNTKVNYRLISSTANKYYLMGSQTTPTSTDSAVTATGSTSAYIIGEGNLYASTLHAEAHIVNEHVSIEYNETDNCLDFVFQ